MLFCTPYVVQRHCMRWPNGTKYKRVRVDTYQGILASSRPLLRPHVQHHLPSPGLQRQIDVSNESVNRLHGAVEAADAEISKARINILELEFTIRCLKESLWKVRNLTDAEFRTLEADADARIHFGYVRSATTLEVFTRKEAEAKIEKAEAKIEKAEAKIEKAEAKIKEAEAKITEEKLEIEKAEAKIKEAEAKIKEEKLEIEKAEAKIKEAEKERKMLVEKAILDAKRAIGDLPDQVTKFADALRERGIVTAGDVFKETESVKSLAMEYKLDLKPLLLNPYLMLLEYPVLSFATRRAFAHHDVADFTKKNINCTLREWGTRGNATNTGAIHTMLDGLSKHLLAFEKMDVRETLLRATAMRPRPMTCNHAYLLGLGLIGRTLEVVEQLRKTGGPAKEDAPLRCIVSAPRSGKTRALDEVAQRESANNPPMMRGQPLVVKKLVVNITYNSHTPLREAESDPLQFYKCFWGRFLRGCAHPLLPNLFKDLVGHDSDTSCTRDDVLKIIKEVYGIDTLDRLVVNVDEFSRVLDLHEGTDKSFKTEYSSFTSLLSGGAQFAFSGFHTDTVRKFATVSGRPSENYTIPTLSPSDLYKHQTAVCIINAAAVNKKKIPFPLADYEASKTSVGLMGFALERCHSGSNSATELFETPWKQTLVRDHAMYKELLFDCLRRTLRGEPLRDTSEKEGLAIRDGDTLSIHPYALYALLNVMTTSIPLSAISFETATLEMWKSFCAAVKTYHTAISATQANAISKAKGPMLETLLGHILHLRALAEGRWSTFRVVERFPTLVDKCGSASSSGTPSPPTAGASIIADKRIENGITEIRMLVQSIKEGQHVVLNAEAMYNIADISVLHRRAGELRIDVYEAKHFDSPMATNEHRNKYLGALVGLLHLRRKNALPGNVRIQFHYVAVLHPSFALKPDDKAAVCEVPPEYARLLDILPTDYSIDGMINHLTTEGVLVEDDRTYQTDQELEKLLTKPFFLLLPDGATPTRTRSDN